VRAQRSFPNARLVTIPDSGHMSQVEHPELVASAVRAFLRTAGGTPAGLR